MQFESILIKFKFRKSIRCHVNAYIYAKTSANTSRFCSEQMNWMRIIYIIYLDTAIFRLIMAIALHCRSLLPNSHSYNSERARRERKKCAMVIINIIINDVRVIIIIINRLHNIKESFSLFHSRMFRSDANDLLFVLYSFRIVCIHNTFRNKQTGSEATTTKMKERKKNKLDDMRFHREIR